MREDAVKLCWRRFVVLALGAMGIVAGCEKPAQFGLQDEPIIVERQPDPIYEELFPRYVELCAVSQFRSLTKGTGGVPGHAVMYLKGACKDEAAPYPRLRRCRGGNADVSDPEHGVGVSVNRWLRNVNWLAFPGRELFYPGYLHPDQRLTQAHSDATVQRALAAGVLRGVELHEYPTAGDEHRPANFLANHSVATDFALQFGRSVFCARMPVTEPMLDDVVGFLNDLNDEYATGEADYHWNGLQDNCVHTLRNALAAASIWSPIPAQLIRLRQVFNLAIPANEFVNLARLGAEGPIDDFFELDGDRAKREALLEFDWLPTRHGALVKTLPVHPANDLFDTTFRLFVLQSPFRRGQTEAAVRLASDGRFVNLEENLHHFADVYQQILDERDDDRFGIQSLLGDRYRRAQRRYYAYVETQQRDVQAMLERVSSAEIEGAQGQLRSADPSMGR
jgi:hypothetical protein